MSRGPKMPLPRANGLVRRRRLDPTKTMAVIAAALVLFAGLAYTLLRDRSWESRATVTLEPAPLVNGNRVGLLDVFDRSGTLGTYVEQISSEDTLEAAGSPRIDIEARSIPDTRVIEIIASGSTPEAVDQGLADVVDVVADEPVEPTEAERRAMDLWTVEPTEQPSRPALQGPSDAILVVATIVIAALAGLFVFVLGRRGQLVTRERFKAQPLEEVPAPPPAGPVAGPNRSGPVRAGQAGPAP